MRLARSLIGLIAGAIVASLAPATLAQDGTSAPQTLTLSPAQLFDFAAQAEARGDFATAEAAYRALAGNPDIELRTEARFRLGMMLAERLHRYADAAIEFRAILDEKPGAARVRLELARMHGQLGHLGAAERELRAAEAAGLPPEVERMVRFYAGALSANKPLGVSLELALAPDSNINRATRSDTLGTTIGEFTLDENAKARSGLGLALRGQAYLRVPINQRARWLTRVSADSDIYRQSRFDDYSLGIGTGPEMQIGRDRLSVSVGPAWRWYGGQLFTISASSSADWQHPLGKRGQLRAGASYARIDNRRNDLQDASSFGLSVGVDRALSARAGIGLQLSASREAARDPGYSTTSGGIGLYMFREFGSTTAVAGINYSHLEADTRLLLYPSRRIDNRYGVSFAGTFRALRIRSFAPFARVRFEANRSTIEIYDYQRVAGEFGLAAAF
ncbi:surface lipoprotein assembly modifier [Novosphingobium sp.]|uniref:surface lipoprotein assembly modifier n=1 Tax=Novosphingobium sp. TaxID=1874826 RepID=UPI0026052A0A|nr:surface lipoprotein assembly modifier [Novosphingobium sp.]